MGEAQGTVHCIFLEALLTPALLRHNLSWHFPGTIACEGSIGFPFEPHGKRYNAAQPQPLNLTNAMFCTLLPPDQRRGNPVVCPDAGRHTY